MGSSASKASRAAASTARKYPSRVPTNTTAPRATNATQRPPVAEASAPGPTVNPRTHASGSRDQGMLPSI